MLYVTKNSEMGFRQNWREGEMNAAEKVTLVSLNLY